MDNKKEFFQKLASVLEKMPNSVFARWVKNRKTCDYEKIRKFIEENISCCYLDDPNLSKKEEESPNCC